MRRKTLRFLFGDGYTKGGSYVLEQGGCVGLLLILAVALGVLLIGTFPFAGSFVAIRLQYPHGMGTCGMPALPYLMCSMVLGVPFVVLACYSAKPLGKSATEAYMRTAGIAEQRVRDREQRQADAERRAGLLSAVGTPGDDDPGTLLHRPQQGESDDETLLRGAKPPSP